MQCRRCGTALERPGDYCLVCRTPNADRVVIESSRTRATVTVLTRDDEIVAEVTHTTTPEDGELRPKELRNFAGRIADEVHRKRPEGVYVAGERSVVQAVRSQLHEDVFRIEGEDPVAEVRSSGESAPLDVVDRPVIEKIGGAHTTLIGGRDGEAVVREVASHPHVKKVVPGPIESGGAGTDSGVQAKATRADGNGNIRVLLRDGSSIQENRIVTTATDKDSGERIRTDLNEALDAADLRG